MSSRKVELLPGAKRDLEHVAEVLGTSIRKANMTREEFSLKTGIPVITLNRATNRPWELSVSTLANTIFQLYKGETDRFLGDLRGEETPEVHEAEIVEQEATAGISLDLPESELLIIGRKARRWGLTIPQFLKALALNADLGVDVYKEEDEVNFGWEEYKK